MKNFIIALFMTLVMAITLSGCQGGIHRDDVGMIAGGVAGGYVGNALTGRTLGTIGGTIGGAYLGREVARRTH